MKGVVVSLLSSSYLWAKRLRRASEPIEKGTTLRPQRPMASPSRIASSAAGASWNSRTSPSMAESAESAWWWTRDNVASRADADDRVWIAGLERIDLITSPALRSRRRCRAMKTPTSSQPETSVTRVVLGKGCAFLYFGPSLGKGRESRGGESRICAALRRGYS